MPLYTTPGVSITRRGANLTGIAVVTVILAGLLLARQMFGGTGVDVLVLQIRTDQVADGIGVGTPVRVAGLRVGEVSDVGDAPARVGRVLTLALDRAELTGVTDALDVQYTASNLFGISAVDLQPTGRGAALESGDIIDLTGEGVSRVSDATLGTMMSGVMDASSGLLTPEFADVLRSVNADMQSFAPLFETVMSISEAFVDTQRYPLPFLLSEFGAFLAGLGALASGTFDLFYDIYNIEVLATDRARFDSAVALIVDGIFPSLATTLGVADTAFVGYTNAFAPLLSAVAATVPDPATSRVELTELVDRLNRIITDDGSGPALAVSVEMDTVPGLAGALANQGLIPTPFGGVR